MKKLVTICILIGTIFVVKAQKKGVIIPENERNACFLYAEAESPVNPNVKILIVSSYIHRRKYQSTDASDKLSNASTNYFESIINPFIKKIDEIQSNERVFISGIAKDIVFDTQKAESFKSTVYVEGYCPISVDEQLKMPQYSSTKIFSKDCRNRFISVKREEGYRVFQVAFDEFYETRDSYDQLWTEEHYKQVVDQVEKLSPLEVEIYKPGVIKNLPNYKTVPVSNYKMPSLIVSSSSSGNNNSSSSSSASSSSATSSSSTSEATVYNNMFLAENARKYNEEKAMQDFVKGVGDLFAPSPEKVAREKRELEAREKIREIEYDKTVKGSKKKFEEVYVISLMTKAKQGDELARMTLIFARNALYHSYNLPDSEKWYSKAMANNNTDALLFEATSEIWQTSSKNESRKYDERLNSYIGLDPEYQNALPYLNKAVDMGSVDAIVFIANWYDLASYDKYYKSYNIEKHVSYPFGNKPELAIEWFKKATDAGSPNAMYYLGMIYKYGRTYNYSNGGNKATEKYRVKYKVKKDEKIAFEYFSKAIQPNYQTTNFAKYQAYHGTGTGYLKEEGDRLSSYFEKNAYLELALMYEKGKVVPKNKIKAEEYRQLYTKHFNINQF
jgi:TPR repeat protein